MLTTGGLVVAHGIGAIARPPMASRCVKLLGAAGLFIFCTFVTAGAAGLIFWRIRRHEGPSLGDLVEFHAVARTIMTMPYHRNE